jgi:hypothetical protein
MAKKNHQSRKRNSGKMTLARLKNLVAVLFWLARLIFLILDRCTD